MEKYKEDADKALRREKKRRAKYERKIEKRRYRQALRKEHRYGTNETLRWDRLDNTADRKSVV